VTDALLVPDASFVVSALIDSGAVGQWCRAALVDAALVAPHLLAAEVTNVVRRSEAAGLLGVDVAAPALSDLARLRVELMPFAPFARRVWELRDNVTSYDAWYVAIAEEFGGRLATLDHRLARTPGPRCVFLEPPR
jgi:predicted nucleic acid-binding protein